jgi:hypothetical protein
MPTYECIKECYVPVSGSDRFHNVGDIVEGTLDKSALKHFIEIKEVKPKIQASCDDPRTNAQLRELLNERGIGYGANANKAKLVELVTASDEAVEGDEDITEE